MRPFICSARTPWNRDTRKSWGCSAPGCPRASCTGRRPRRRPRRRPASGLHQPRMTDLAPRHVSMTAVDGRARVARTIIDHRLDGPCWTQSIGFIAGLLFDSSRLDSSRSLGQGNAVWIGGIRVRKAIRLGSTPEGARWRRKACGMISRPGCRRSIADVGVRITPNRRPRGTSSPGPGHWRGTVWPSRRRRLHAIPQAGAWTTREGPATHQPAIKGPSSGRSTAEGIEGEDRAGGDQAGDRGPCGRNRGSGRKLEARPGHRPDPALRSSEGRAFTCGTASVAIAAPRQVVGWPGGRAKSRRRHSGRDETVTNPDVRIGATSTDASSASEDVSQSVETRLLRSGMAPRFSNVVIRGSLARSGEMAFYQIASRILRLAGEAQWPHPLYSDSTCEETPKFRTNQSTTSKS